MNEVDGKLKLWNHFFFLIFWGILYYSIGSWLYVYFEYVSQVGDPNDSQFTFMDPNYVFFSL